MKASWFDTFKLNSHLRFLGMNYCLNFSVHAIAKKWVHNPLLNFSVHAIVDQIAGVNTPIYTVSPITQRLVQVHAIVEKITGVNGPLHSYACILSSKT